MKAAVIFAALIAGIAASVVPQPIDIGQKNNARFVDDIISAAIEDFSQQIRDAGLDPWTLDRMGTQFELPVPMLLSIDSFISNVRFTGISDIVINSINFGIFSQRLTLDISIPQITLSIGDAAFDVTVLGHNISGRTSSSLTIVEPRVSGEILVNVLGIISGSLIRSIDLEFDLEALRYNGNLIVQGVELAPAVNQFLSVGVMSAIENVRDEINELVEIIAWVVVEQLLG